MLHDEKKRPDIDSVMAHARHLVIKESVSFRIVYRGIRTHSFGVV
jgi:hypothetical protein